MDSPNPVGLVHFLAGQRRTKLYTLDFISNMGIPTIKALLSSIALVVLLDGGEKKPRPLSTTLSLINPIEISPKEIAHKKEAITKEIKPNSSKSVSSELTVQRTKDDSILAVVHVPRQEK